MTLERTDATRPDLRVRRREGGVGRLPKQTSAPLPDWLRALIT